MTTTDFFDRLKEIQEHAYTKYAITNITADGALRRLIDLETLGEHCQLVKVEKEITLPFTPEHGKLFKRERKRRGLSQREAARAIGAKQPYVSDAECGHPRSMPVIESMCQLYGITIVDQ